MYSLLHLFFVDRPGLAFPSYTYLYCSAGCDHWMDLSLLRLCVLTPASNQNHLQIELLSRYTDLSQSHSSLENHKVKI